MNGEIPDDENGDVLRRLLKAGDNLSLPRDVDFSIVFPTKRAAKLFINAISGDFKSVNYKESHVDPELVWDVTAVKFMVPDHQLIGETEDFLAEKAKSFGGRNDGWGCFSIKGN
jgi:hypothetical protein